LNVDAINELVNVLRSSAGYVMSVAVVALFATMAFMLWAWRRVALDDEDDEHA
jgi:hypothetical protein